MNTLLDSLIKEEILSKGDLTKAMDRQWKEGGAIEENLIRLETLGELEIVKIFVRMLGFPLYVPDLLVDVRPLALILRTTAKKHSVIPVKSDNKYIVVVMANPLDNEAIEAVEDETGLKVIAMVAPKSQVDNTIIKHYL